MKKNLKVKDADFEKMKKVYSNREKYVEYGHHFYLSYQVRIALMILCIVVLAVLAYRCFDESFSEEKNIELNYSEKASIDYNVSLLENNLFNQGELNPVDTYIAGFIDDISTDFKYDFELDDVSNIKYTYYVDTVMELRDNKTGDILSQKFNKLIPETSKEIKNTKILNFVQNVNLDYDSYNDLAKTLKDSSELQDLNADINGNIYLRLYIDIDVSNDKFKKDLKHSDVIEVKIPILSTQVDVAMTEKVDGSHTYIQHVGSELINEPLLFIGIVLLIVDTIFLLTMLSFIFKTTPKKTKYMRLRDGLLREHDSIIVNSKNVPSSDGYSVIDCYSFSELLDAQRLVNKPIIYNELVKNQKCIFVLVSGNEIYRFILKEVDIDF
ncbi:MAG: hypothetical protein ACI4XM_01070 [Candidatus Coprovivens sp.]